MDIIEIVMAGNKPWQHARVRGVGVAADQRQTHSRHGPHAELSKYRDMTVPAADEHEVLHSGSLRPVQMTRSGSLLSYRSCLDWTIKTGVTRQRAVASV